MKSGKKQEGRVESDWREEWKLTGRKSGKGKERGLTKTRRKRRKGMNEEGKGTGRMRGGGQK